MQIDVELIGFIAAFLTTGAFVPQAVMIWRTDDTRSISLGMYTMMTVGIGLWLVYALYINSAPMIATNVVTGTLAAMILYKKYRHVRAGKA